jgi:competence protein ComEA
MRIKMMKLKYTKSVSLALLFTAGLLSAHAQNTPTAPATPPASPVAPTSPAAPAPCKATAVNVNTAPQSELVKIPGINAKLADAIIAARPFKNEADLVKRVKGIGKKNIVTFRPCFTY